jgi:hypothetical protein
MPSTLTGCAWRTTATLRTSWRHCRAREQQGAASNEPSAMCRSRVDALYEGVGSAKVHGDKGMTQQHLYAKGCSLTSSHYLGSACSTVYSADPQHPPLRHIPTLHGRCAGRPRCASRCSRQTRGGRAQWRSMCG